MKTLFSIIAFAFSITASAHQDIVSYEYGVRAEVSNLTNVTVSIKTVTVDSEGVITVEQAPLVFGGIATEKEIVAQKKLTSETFNQISGMVSAISNAEIVEHFADVVCTLAVSLEQSFDHLSTARQYDWQSGKYLAPMQVVQGPQGCWVSHSIYLEDERSNDTATRLKAMLRVLGQELN